jgi:hypothetical protein
VRALAIIACLLLLPLATALDTNSVRFLIDGQEIEYVSFGQTIAGQLRFTPHQDSFQMTITAPNLQQPVSLDPRRCQGECAVMLELSMEERITLEFTEHRYGGRQLTRTVVIPPQNQPPFRIDDEPPTIKDISIGGCSQGCAIGPHQNTLTFRATDTQSRVNTEGVQVSHATLTWQGTIANEPAFNYTITRQTDGPVTITVPDRAGNTATTTIEVRYDATPPEVREDPQWQTMSGELVQGQPSTIRAVVREPERAYMTIVTPDGNFTSQCTRSAQANNDLVCIVEVRPTTLVEGGQVQVVFTDDAKNRATRTAPYTVRAGSSDVAPNFWDVTATPLSRVDANLWRVTPAHIPFNIVLTKTAPHSGRVASITVSSCTLQGVSGQNAILVEQKPSLPTGTGNTVSTRAQLSIAPQGARVLDQDHDLFKNPINCEIRVTTRVGNTVFTQPEIKQVSINPDNLYYRLPDPTQRVNEANQKALQTATEWQTRIATASLLMSSVGAVCSLQKDVQLGAVGIATAAAGLLAGSTLDATGTLLNAANALSRTGDGVDKANNALTKAIAPMCKYISCDNTGPYQSFMDQLPLMTGGSTGGQAVAALGGVSEPSQLVDPYKSLPVAIATVCGPAILYHFTQYADTHCAYQQCLEHSPRTGQTIGDCEYVRSQQQCEFISGSLYYAVPYTNVWGTITGQLEQAFSNPFSLFGGIAGVACGAGANFLDSMETLPVYVRIPCQIADYPNKYGKYLEVASLVSHGLQRTQQVRGAQTYCEQVVASPSRLQTPITPFRWDQACQLGYSTHQEGSDILITFDGSRGQETFKCLGQSATTAGETPGYAQELATTGCAGFERIDSSHPAHASARQRHQQCRDSLQTTELFASEEYQRAASSTAALQTARDNETQKTAERRIQEGELQAAVNAGSQTVRSNPVLAPIADDLARQLEFTANLCSRGPTCPDLRQEIRTNAMNQLAESGLSGPELEAAVNEYMDAYDNVVKESGDVRSATEQEEQAETQRKDAENANKEAQRALQSAVIREQWGGGINALRNGVNSFVLWGRTGGLVQEFIGQDIGNIPAMDSLSETMGVLREGPEQWAVQNICRGMGVSDPGVPTATVGLGKAAARISAVGTAWTAASGQAMYSYAVDVFLEVPGGEQEPARVTLQSPDRTNLHQGNASRLHRTGTNAIPHEDEIRFNRACLSFDKRLGELFEGVSGGASANSHELCTEVKWT